MTARTYAQRVVVLRKTKLGESDLILTALATDGSQMRFVAKGARKPTSSFASRLELFAVADVLCCTGRSLDIVKEARLVAGNDRIRGDLERASAAAPTAELLDRVTQIGLENSKLFDMTVLAYRLMSETNPSDALAIASAHMLKTLAFAGFKPQLDACVLCGEVYASDSCDAFADFSVHEGGYVCPSCKRDAQVVPVSKQAINWSRFYMSSTFDDIVAAHPSPNDSFAVLSLLKPWIGLHVGARLKSLDFLFSSGLY